MSDAQVQIPFDLRVLQHALTQVISEDDAACLAKMILRLTDANNSWVDSAFLEGEQIALKALICFEVMRSYRKQVGNAGPLDEFNPGLSAERSFANVYRALEAAETVLAEEAAWLDFVKYSPPTFKTDLLKSLAARMQYVKDLGPYQEAN